MRIFRMLLLLTAAVVAAQAQAVTWYLQDVTMSDGAQAVGSFTYDLAPLSHMAFGNGSGTGQHYAALLGTKGQLRLLAVRGGSPPYIGLNAMLFHATSNAAITAVTVTAQ